METLKNLTKAFVGESQARNRYTFYAKIAKKEGYEQISEIFLTTAENEKEHAKQLFKMIQTLKKNNDAVIVETEAPTVYGKTTENLKAAIEGESFENKTMYPEFARVASTEGHPGIAEKIIAIGKAEAHHEERYKALLKELEAETIFRKDTEQEWVCRKCGYVHTGTQPAIKCPSCDHEHNYFELKCEKY
jgi:rubrerythrin